MKKSTLIFTATAIVIVLAAVPFTFAQMRGRHHGMSLGADGAGMLGHLQKAQQELGLSDQQVADIKSIFKALHDQNAPYRASLKGGKLQIAQTLLANPNDTAAAQALLDQQTTAERAMKANMLASVAKAAAVLTPDQRAKVAQHLKNRQARMQQWHQKHSDQ
jgi:protein CpxP